MTRSLLKVYLLSNSKSVAIINRLREEEEDPGDLTVKGSPGGAPNFGVVVVALRVVVELHGVGKTF